MLSFQSPKGHEGKCSVHRDKLWRSIGQAVSFLDNVMAFQIYITTHMSVSAQKSIPKTQRLSLLRMFYCTYPYLFIYLRGRKRQGHRELPSTSLLYKCSQWLQVLVAKMTTGYGETQATNHESLKVIQQWEMLNVKAFQE